MNNTPAHPTALPERTTAPPAASGRVVVTPVDAGGADGGPTPVEPFVISPASCIAYYAGWFLQRHRLPREGLRVLPPVEPSGARSAALRAVVDHCTSTTPRDSRPRYRSTSADPPRAAERRQREGRLSWNA